MADHAAMRQRLDASAAASLGRSAGPLLEVRDLAVEFPTKDGLVIAPNAVSFDVDAGEILGIVGESGSGKSTTARALVQLLPTPGRISNGVIRFRGRDLASLNDDDMSRVRGAEIGYVFQDARAALSPLLAIGSQIREAMPKGRPPDDVVELLREVGIADPQRRQHDYPHQFSGGMCQRVMIATAIANRPDLLIADEPTSSLDVTTQAQILELLRSLVQKHRMAMILISHDMGVIAEMCDRIAVMYGGRILESGPARQLLTHAYHPYTRALLACSPRLQQNRGGSLRPIEGSSPSLISPPAGCVFQPRCSFAVERCRTAPSLVELPGARYSACWLAAQEILGKEHRTATFLPRADMPVRPPDQPHARKPPLLELTNVKKCFAVHGASRFRLWGNSLEVRAVDGVSMGIQSGETLALVGESGSGKSTVGRLICRVYRPTAGRVFFDGTDIGNLKNKDMRLLRRRIQMILQDPYSSLNPRMTIEEIVSEPLRVHPDLATYRRAIGKPDRKSMKDLILQAVRAVGLTDECLARYPHQFSGGQRQRISIARALVLRPSLIVADEPVSSLDVSAQAQIVNLLRSLQEQFALTYLFITHDLGLVRHIASRVAVMYLGRIVEAGPVDIVFTRPRHPYTAALLRAARIDDAPNQQGRGTLQGEIPSSMRPPSGCRFRTRCPIAEPLCATLEPPERLSEDGHMASCHFPERSSAQVLRDESQPVY